MLLVVCLALGHLNTPALTNLLVGTLQVAYLVFAINAMQSLENEAVRAQVLKLVNLQLWHALSPGRLKVREQLLGLSSQLLASQMSDVPDLC